RCVSGAARRSPWPLKWSDLPTPSGAAIFVSAFFSTQDSGSAMPVIETRINPRSQAFIDNARAMQAQLDDLQDLLTRTALGGNEASRARHVARGKLLPRDRVERLLDPGSPFLELSPLAAHDVYDNDAPGAGIITGIGRVAGTECMIVCNDATV